MIHLRSQALPNPFFQALGKGEGGDPKELVEGLLKFLHPEQGVEVKPSDLPRIDQRPVGNFLLGRGQSDGQELPLLPVIPGERRLEDEVDQFFSQENPAGMVMPTPKGGDMLLPAMFVSETKPAEAPTNAPAARVATIPLNLPNQAKGTPMVAAPAAQNAQVPTETPVKNNPTMVPVDTGTETTPLPESGESKQVLRAPRLSVLTGERPAPMRSLDQIAAQTGQPTPEQQIQMRGNAERRVAVAPNRPQSVAKMAMPIPTAPGKTSGTQPGVAMAPQTLGNQRRVMAMGADALKAERTEVQIKVPVHATTSLREAFQALTNPLRGSALAAPPASTTTMDVGQERGDGPDLQPRVQSPVTGVYQGVEEVGNSRRVGEGISSEARSVIKQITSPVEQVVINRATPRSLTLHLTPPELGRIEIRVESDGKRESAVNVVIRADRPETERLLHQHMNHLRESLEDSGVDLGGMVLEDSGSEFANSGGRDDFAEDARTPSEPEQVEERPKPTPTTHPARSSSTRRLSVVA